MSIRLGELLVVQGFITPEQQKQILEMQKSSGRPFGVIAEEEFGVEPGAIEQAWAVQYAMIAQRIDPSELEIPAQVLELVSKRQAWQFGFVPYAIDGDEILIAASRVTLARSLRFVNWRLNGVCTFAICDLKTLRRSLETHYPFPGADAALIDRFSGKNNAA